MLTRPQIGELSAPGGIEDNPRIHTKDPDGGTVETTVLMLLSITIQ